jgi:hypothetical protein
VRGEDAAPDRGSVWKLNRLVGAGEFLQVAKQEFIQVPDYAVSTAQKGAAGGYVAVFSGKDGDEIGGFTTGEPVWFWSIAGPGDLTGDGRADIALGLWSEVNPWRRGQVRVISGELFGGEDASGARIDIDSEEALLVTFIKVDGRTGEAAGPSGIEALGQGLNRVGDVDGDGTPDVGVGTGAGDDAVILSGADGSRLHEWTSDRLKFSQRVVETAGIGDVNRDGFRDVVVGRTGSVRLMSGKDGALLAEVLEPERGDDLGEEIAAIGDLNGDGISEVLAGAPRGGYPANLIRRSWH